MELHQEIVASGQATWDSYNFLAFYALEYDSDISEAIRLYNVAKDAYPEYYGCLDYYRLLILVGEVDSALQIASESGVRMDNRMVSLVDATREFRDSGRSDAAPDKHLVLDGISYLEKVENWKESEDLYGQFLALVARILEPYCYDSEFRAEVKSDVERFVATHQKYEQSLADYLQALLTYQY